tara:strand:+ start:553 stop:735 length:183 start_codon:yes stop_codon:yes gene_type:complete
MKKSEWLKQKIMCDGWGRPPSGDDVPLLIMTRKEALIKQGNNDKTIDKLYKEAMDAEEEQ